MNKEKIRVFEQLINNKYNNIAGIVVYQGGHAVYENYFNKCTADSRLHIYSVTKSILSLLIGIAIDEGHIESVNQKVLDFFPDYQIRKNEKTIQNITLQDVLTMTAPYKYRFTPYLKYFTSNDWVTFTLDLLGGRGKTGVFNYVPLVGPDLFSGILTKATGKTVLDFASENLFTPLGISVGGNVFFHSTKEQLAFSKATDISGWVSDSKGINAGGWGLTLSAPDMAKIGQLCLNNGSHNGRQLVSEKWIKESTVVHSRWEKTGLCYGYLWWCIDEEENAFAAMGDGGNVIYVNKAKSMVVSIASLFRQNVNDRLDFIRKYVEPAFVAAGR